MSTKITSPRAELAVLRAMTHKNRAIAGTIVGQVDESYFEAEESRELYGAMRRHLATTGETPSFKLLVEDPDLSTHARTFMRDSEPVVDTIEDAVRAVKILNKYRQTRGLYKLAAEIDAALESPRFDVDQMMERASNSVASIRSNRSARDSFVHFGTDNNSTELMKDTFFGSSEDLVIPTGIKPFDEQSGGFLRGGLVTIGASSGGGKCCSLETRIQLSTLIIETDTGVVLELEPEDMVFVLTANGEITSIRGDQISQGVELLEDPDKLLQHFRLAIVTSVRIKTRSFREIAMDAALSTANKGFVPELLLQSENLEFKGIAIPHEIRVRTIEGIRYTDNVVISRGETIRVTMESGRVIEGTHVHKLMVDQVQDEWVQLKDLEIGSVIRLSEGYDTVELLERFKAKPVADICVPGPHSYLIDNGIVSHNSFVALQIAKNMAESGHRVLLVPLEMSKSEMTSRLAANISGLDVTRILQRKLATAEAETGHEKMRKWARRVKTRGGRFTIYKPTEDLTIDEIFATVNSYDCDVVIIDYISLLKGADGEDSWQKLGAMARTAKINAENTQRVNILLCQVNDEGKIRYARSISEHSSNSFIWVTQKAEREKEIGRVRVEQPKSRNSRSFPFEIGMQWAQMRVVDVESHGDVGEIPVPKPRKNLTDV